MSVSLLILGLALAGPLPDGDHPGQLTTQVEGPASVHNGTAPSAVFDARGTLHVAFVKGDHVYVSHSSDLGQTFSPPTVVNSHLVILSVSGENRPCIAVAGDHVYVAYTEALPGRFISRLMFARSIDGGESFQKPRQLNDDQVIAGHAFPAMALGADGALTVAWLDGRDRVDPNAPLGSSIYATRSNDRGASFSPNQRWVQGVCQCCRLALALDDQQRPNLVWRHIFDGQIRDHAIGQLTADGNFHQDRLTYDLWHIEGCPHQGPALALDSLGRRHVAWFTVRDGQSELRYARQEGASTTSQLLDGQGGMHPSLLIQDHHLLIAWIRGGEQGTQLFLQRSSDLGQTLGPAQILAQTPGLADHPQLLNLQSRIYVTWQTQTGFQLLPLEP